jgi:hypothetical protein
MKKSNNTHENVVNLQMSAIDAADDLSSMWEDALSSVSAESSFKQQALIWYVIFLKKSITMVKLKILLCQNHQRTRTLQTYLGEAEGKAEGGFHVEQFNHVM